MARLDRHQFLIRMGYDGSRFYGVPNQPGHPTVERSLRARLEASTDQRARALCFTARTDRGVHAVENFATCWLLPPFDDEAFSSAMASDRPDGLETVSATRTGFHTHARNLSQGKWYRYQLRMDGGEDDRAWAIEDELDMEEMTVLAQAFVGRHDFSAYRFKSSSPDRVKTISRVALERTSTGLNIDIEGDGFLRHMVRKMVSTLVGVGTGDFELEWALNLLSSGSPRGALPAAPAHGLTLMAIHRAQD